MTSRDTLIEATEQGGFVDPNPSGRNFIERGVWLM